MVIFYNGTMNIKRIKKNRGCKLISFDLHPLFFYIKCIKNYIQGNNKIRGRILRGGTNYIIERSDVNG